MINKSVFYTFDEFIEKFEWTKSALVSDFALLGYTLTTSITTEVAVINKVLSLVVDRFSEYYLYKKDIPFEDEDYQLTNDDAKILARKLVSIVNLSYERYIPLLKSYDKYKDDPTDGIESSSDGETRFNDTPQNASSDSLYLDDEKHASNITKSHATTKMDVDSISDRLDKLYRNWRDIVRDWTNEFKGLFMEVFA